MSASLSDDLRRLIEAAKTLETRNRNSISGLPSLCAKNLRIAILALEAAEEAERI